MKLWLLQTVMTNFGISMIISSEKVTDSEYNNNNITLKPITLAQSVCGCRWVSMYSTLYMCERYVSIWLKLILFERKIAYIYIVHHTVTQSTWPNKWKEWIMAHETISKFHSSNSKNNKKNIAVCALVRRQCIFLAQRNPSTLKTANWKVLASCVFFFSSYPH